MLHLRQRVTTHAFIVLLPPSPFSRVFVEEQDEIPGHSVGDLDVKMEVGRNLGLRKSKQDYKKGRKKRKKVQEKIFLSLCISVV